jgi:asparagine synthase (glutamine-hydrolysing)
MCGLVGIISTEFSKQDDMVARIERMKTTIAHRGLDGTGTYIDPDALPVVFGHSRLAIIDPEHGQQPMTTSDKMVTVI